MQTEVSSKRDCPMDERERFGKLYELIVDIFRSYTTNFVWTVGLFSLAIGWLFSSANGRDFIRSSRLAFIGAVLIVIVIGLVHTASCWWYYRRSQQKIAQLEADYQGLHPLPFRDYEIRRSILVANLVVAWTLAVGLITFFVGARLS